MSDLQFNRNFALEQSGDDEEMLAELLTLFKTSSVDDFKRIQAAYTDKNAKNVAEAAHSIKGAAASLGIDGIRQVASDLEKAGSEGNLDSAGGLIERLGKMFEAFDVLK